MDEKVPRNSQNWPEGGQGDSLGDKGHTHNEEADSERVSKF